jgi:probable rRNA maturation factor
MGEILFFSTRTQFKLKNTKKTIHWLELLCKTRGYQVESVTYVFCSDNYLRDLNIKFLKHSTFTDILSFDTSVGKLISGEIFISIPRVRENARKFHQEFDLELRRVLCHGLLHFMGFSDKNKSQKALMRAEEEACLSLWK